MEQKEKFVDWSRVEANEAAAIDAAVEKIMIKEKESATQGQTCPLCCGFGRLLPDGHCLDCGAGN